MCYIEKRIKRITNKERVAWKCISSSSTPTMWRPLTMLGEFRRGAWQKALNTETGFNCYISEKLARDSGWSTDDRPVKVRIRGIQGFDEAGEIVFAREIFVPKRLRGGL